jgi:hypothetical protein
LKQQGDGIFNAALLVFEELRRLERLPKDISKELEKTTKPCRHEKL